MKILTLAAIAILSTGCASAPSKTECKITGTINNPTSQLIAVVGFVSGVIDPVGGTVALATSAYRGSKCPKPVYLTEEQIQDRIKAAIEAERGAK
jgi:hypothetical protein